MRPAYTPPPVLPDNARKDWQAFRRVLARDAANHTPPIVISRTMWNAIRNAWKDGYWANHYASRVGEPLPPMPGYYGHRYSM